MSIFTLIHLKADTLAPQPPRPKNVTITNFTLAMLNLLYTDFVKWWRTTGFRGKFDWDSAEGYMDIKNANAFEDIEAFTDEFPEISYAACVLLLKSRLLSDVITLKRLHAGPDSHSPEELLAKAQKQLQSSIVKGDREMILDRGDRSAQIEELSAQLFDCYTAVKKANRYFWPAMLDPGEFLTAGPQMYTPGSLAEMTLKLQYCYDAFAETPTGFAGIEELMTIDKETPG